MVERATQREVALASILEVRKYEHGRIPEETWTAIVNGIWEMRHNVVSGRGASQDLMTGLLDTVARESLDG